MKESESRSPHDLRGFINGMSGCESDYLALTKSTNGVLRLMRISPEKEEEVSRRKSAT